MRSIMTGAARALVLAAVSFPGLALGQDGIDPPPPSTGEGGFSLDVPPDQGPHPGDVSLAVFQSALAPYGSWVDIPGHGPVWRPAVATGWRPYLHGRWVWTDAGWYWVSDEPWGWGPYHYGRWGHDAAGWYWAPGYEWAPAWVDWRYSASVVGWAPLAPAWWIAAPVFTPAWTFMPCTRFAGYPVHGWAYPATYHAAFYGQTRPAPPRHPPHAQGMPGWGGPPRPFVEGRMGRHLPAASVRPGPAAGTPSRRGNVPGAGPRRGGQPSGAPRWGGGTGGTPRATGAQPSAPRWSASSVGARRWSAAPRPSAARTFASVPASRTAVPGWAGRSSGGPGGGRAVAASPPAGVRGSVGVARAGGRPGGLAPAGGRHR
jgi:hypothetical protein